MTLRGERDTDLSGVLVSYDSSVTVDKYGRQSSVDPDPLLNVPLFRTL